MFEVSMDTEEDTEQQKEIEQVTTESQKKLRPP